MRSALLQSGLAALLFGASVSAESHTPKHELGRCAFRGQCGKQSFFGKELPCVDNGLAEDPSDDLRKELVELCGPQWSEGPVCCNLDQVSFVLFYGKRLILILVSRLKL